MRIILFTDSCGITQFENSPLFQKNLIIGVVGAFNRAAGHPAIDQSCKSHNIPFLVQPSFQSAEYITFEKTFQALTPTHIISNSYSLIIRNSLLDYVDRRAINIHWSLLPKNRGPNPIQWALIKNEIETGVSVHQITSGIDEGPIILQKKISIHDDDTWVTLMDRLKNVSQSLISYFEIEEALIRVKDGFPQDNSIATVNSRLNIISPRIKFEEMNDREVFNLIRAQIAPLAGAYAIIQGKPVHFKHFLTFDQVTELRKYYLHNDIEMILKLSHGH